MGVELPLRLKWLLVASYIASNNPPSHDARYFGEVSVKKSIRSASKKAKVRRRFAMPTAFTFDRMIAVYFSIFEVNSNEPGRKKEDIEKNRTPTQDSELYTQ